MMRKLMFVCLLANFLGGCSTPIEKKSAPSQSLLLSPGKSITLERHQFILFPSGSTVSTPEKTVVKVIGHRNIFSATPGTIVSAPQTIEGDIDNVAVIVEAGQSQRPRMP